MIKDICIYEPGNTKNYYPFSILHCIWEIRCGALRTFERVQKQFEDAEIFYYGRKEHLDSFFARFSIDPKDKPDRDILYLAGNFIADDEAVKQISKACDDSSGAQVKIFMKESAPAGAMIPADIAGKFIDKSPEEMINSIQNDPDINKIILAVPGGVLLNYLYDAIFENGDMIRYDSGFFENSEVFYEPAYPNVFAIESVNIKLGKNVKIGAGAVIDATEGPVIIGGNVEIMPQATVIGPCYIGENSKIKIGAKIYEDCSFGEYCKVGGEVENTIIQSYSNKQHEGFLGHSFISEWVNLGADTNNSDLKNTYGEISIQLDDIEVDTGKMFLGLLCGDHTKSAINTQFNTGTAAGIFGILVTEGFLPKFIHSFAWGGRFGSPVYKINKAFEVAEKVMHRRGKKLLDEEKILIQAEHERCTDAQRKKT